MVMKMTKKYAHNMTLMSKYEELLLDEKRPKHLGKTLPPPRHYICRDWCNQWWHVMFLDGVNFSTSNTNYEQIVPNSFLDCSFSDHRLCKFCYLRVDSNWHQLTSRVADVAAMRIVWLLVSIHPWLVAASPESKIYQTRKCTSKDNFIKGLLDQTSLKVLSAW